MAKKGKRPARFTATLAVKANARERLGTPPPSVVIPDDEHKQAHGKPKHRQTLERVLEKVARGEDVD